MIKLIDSTPEVNKIIPMRDMKPLEVGVIYDVNSSHNGHYVMRTESVLHHEVMNLTNPVGGNCWSKENELKVRLLGPGESITIKLSNIDW